MKSDGSTAPAEAASQGFGAIGGAAQEPGYDSQYAVGYQDFSSDPLFGPNGPSPDDINQGANGDCYFLATLSDIAPLMPSGDLSSRTFSPLAAAIIR